MSILHDYGYADYEMSVISKHCFVWNHSWVVMAVLQSMLKFIVLITRLWFGHAKH